MTPAVALCIALPCLGVAVTLWAVHRILDGELATMRAYNATLRAERDLLRGEVANLRDNNELSAKQLSDWSAAKRVERRWES